MWVLLPSLTPLVHVPPLHRAIVGARGYLIAGWREGHGQDAVRLGEGVDGPARRHVPDPRRLVSARRGRQAAGWAERSIANPVLMSLQCPFEASGLRVPDLRRVVCTRGDDPLP